MRNMRNAKCECVILIYMKLERTFIPVLQLGCNFGCRCRSRSIELSFYCQRKTNFSEEENMFHCGFFVLMMLVVVLVATSARNKKNGDRSDRVGGKECISRSASAHLVFLAFF